MPYFMMKLLIIFSFIISVAYGQIDTSASTRECKQYLAIMKFIKTDSLSVISYDVKEVRLKIDSVIYSPVNLMQKLGIIIDMISLDKGILTENINSDTLHKYWTKYRSQNNIDTIDHKLDCCIDCEKKPNVLLRFSRYNSNIVFVFSRRIYNKPKDSYGYYYTFKFNENNNFEYRKYNWME
jgi:hypothetical protein